MVTSSSIKLLVKPNNFSKLLYEKTQIPAVANSKFIDLNTAILYCRAKFFNYIV